MVNIEILVGSTLGGTEYVAEAAQPFLSKAGFTSTVHFNPDLTTLDITKDAIWLVCLSTHGAGDYPENFKPFVEQIKQVCNKLSTIQFGLIGVGDSNYDTYCLAAKNFNALLQEKGASRLGQIFEIDIIESPIPEDRVEDWIPIWIEDLNYLAD